MQRFPWCLVHSIADSLKPGASYRVRIRDMTTLSPAAVIRETPEKSFVHVDRLPGSSTAARKAASRAVKEGLLLPVRRVCTTGVGARGTA